MSAGHHSRDSAASSRFSSNHRIDNTYPQPDGHAVQQVMRGGGLPDDSLLHVSWGDALVADEGPAGRGGDRSGSVSASLSLPEPADAHISLRLGAPQYILPEDEEEEEEGMDMAGNRELRMGMGVHRSRAAQGATLDSARGLD